MGPCAAPRQRGPLAVTLRHRAQSSRDGTLPVGGAKPREVLMSTELARSGHALTDVSHGGAR